VATEALCKNNSDIFPLTRFASFASSPYLSCNKHAPIFAIGDSGTTDTLVRPSSSHLLSNITPCNSYRVSLPNGQVITATHRGTFAIPSTGIYLPSYIFPDTILQHNLLSFSRLCNLDCTVTLTSIDATVTHKGAVVLHGTKSASDTLWLVDLICKPSDPSPSVANLTIKLDTDADFVAFVHASFGSPPVATFLAAARAGWLDGYPRITATMISANQPNSVATAKGHLDQTRQRKKHRVPTRTAPLDLELDESPDLLDVTAANSVIVQTVPSSDFAHADSTGRFPVASRRGNQYILVFTWKGYVHYEPMPSRTASSYLAAYTRAWTFYSQFGPPPSFMRLDNETSELLESFAKERHFTIQYVPPGTHRANRAEREIRRSKNHLISILCSAHEAFPLLLWDEALPQAELTINHLRAYGPDPSICAYDGLHGQRYDFSAHPIAPFGTLVVVHDKPGARGTWDPHGDKGYYLGAALQHHKCWRTWIISTNSERISDTLAWFPAPFKLPGSSPYEMVTAALQDLTAALQLFSAGDHMSPTQNKYIRDTVLTATQSLHSVIQLYTSSQHPSAIPVPSPAIVTPPRSATVRPLRHLLLHPQTRF